MDPSSCREIENSIRVSDPVDVHRRALILRTDLVGRRCWGPADFDSDESTLDVAIRPVAAQFNGVWPPLMPT